MQLRFFFFFKCEKYHYLDNLVTNYPVKALVTCLRIIWKGQMTIVTESFTKTLSSFQDGCSP